MQVVSIAFLSKFCRGLFESVCKVLSRVSRDERAGWFFSGFMAEFMLTRLWICFSLSQFIRLDDLRLSRLDTSFFLIAFTMKVRDTQLSEAPN